MRPITALLFLEATDLDEAVQIAESSGTPLCRQRGGAALAPPVCRRPCVRLGHSRVVDIGQV